MGYMTEVSILNDRWDEIRKEPVKFVEQLYSNCASDGRVDSYVIGQTTVARTHHADDVKVYYAGQNSFFEAWPERKWDIRRLKLHLTFLKWMTAHLKVATKETQRLLDVAEGQKVLGDNERLP